MAQRLQQSHDAGFRALHGKADSVTSVTLPGTVTILIMRQQQHHKVVHQQQEHSMLVGTYNPVDNLPKTGIDSTTAVLIKRPILST